MGYRMAHALVQAEFSPLNVKRVHRVWKEAKLSRKRRCKKKRTGKAVPLAAEHANHVWCVDFCHDACLNGTKLKILAVKDEYTRELLALEVGTSLRSVHVRRVLEEVLRRRPAPKFFRSDNGPEFIARCLAVFLSRKKIDSHFIAPGSPWQNGHAESFVSRLRDDLLDVEVFHNLADAQIKLAVYRRYYNETRPHSSLGYRTPASFAAQLPALGPTTQAPAGTPVGA